MNSVRTRWAGWGLAVLEIGLLWLTFFAVASSPPPAINEAHYLVKAKNYWQPEWLAHDPFVASGKAHVTFYHLFGWLTLFFDLPTVAWIGRAVGWLMLAVGLWLLARTLFPVRSDNLRNYRGAFLALPIAVVWIAGVTYANLAGEWVVGGIEAKVPAYGLALAGLAMVTRGRWTLGWLLLGGAAAFHVLVGGWSVVAAMVVRATCLRGRSKCKLTSYEMAALVGGGALALFGLLPGLRLGMGASAEEQILAARTYAYGRLGHHLTPSMFPWNWYARHGAMILLTGIAGWSLVRSGRLFNESTWRRFLIFCAAAVGIGLIGLAVGVVPAFNANLGAKLLRFYWFRLTDAYVPLAAGAVAMAWVLTSIDADGARFWRPVALATIALSTAVLGRDYLLQWEYDLPGAVARAHDIKLVGRPPMTNLDREHVFVDWLAVCDYVREELPAEATFITPRAQHTFRWYAERAEVVNWKDVPQDAEGLIDWARRINRVFPISLWRRHTPMDRETLSQLAETYGAQYIIVDRRVVPGEPELTRLYPLRSNENTTYAVYTLPLLSSANVPQATVEVSDEEPPQNQPEIE